LPDPENSTYAVVKEKIMVEINGVKILASNFLLDAYTDKVMHLVESGIIENILSYFKPQKPPNNNDDHIALSMDHLMIWFQLWAALLMVAVLFFFCEILMTKLVKILIKKAIKALNQIRESFENID
jgi:hypothetical protein